jgi:8-oxo-dGTP diphosphatase
MADTPASAPGFTYRYPRPGLTADIVLWTIQEDALHLLLIQRKHPPFQGSWALPGGFVNEMEPPEAAAARELQEETGVASVPLRQCGAFGAPGRDPRGWTVSIAFTGLVPFDRLTAQAGDDAAAVGWHNAAQLPPLAFDHADIIAAGLTVLRRDMLSLLKEADWLPEQFTWPELLQLCEIIQGGEIDGSRWRRRWVREKQLFKIKPPKGRKRDKKERPLWTFQARP